MTALATIAAGLPSGGAVRHGGRAPRGEWNAVPPSRSGSSGPSHRRAAVVQVLLAVAGCGAGVAAWARGRGAADGSSAPCCSARCFHSRCSSSCAVNHRLLDAALDRESPEAADLLDAARPANAIRTVGRHRGYPSRSSDSRSTEAHERFSPARSDHHDISTCPHSGHVADGLDVSGRPDRRRRRRSSSGGSCGRRPGAPLSRPPARSAASWRRPHRRASVDDEGDGNGGVVLPSLPIQNSGLCRSCRIRTPNTALPSFCSAWARPPSRA